MKIIIIAAVAKNGVIGDNGKIPWHSSEDFKHFKRTTLGFPIIMGRKTFESIGNPLKNRTNIVLTRNTEYTVPSGVVLKKDLNEAIEFCRSEKAEKAFIIGGSEIYKKAILIADELLISEMKFEASGNIQFPVIDNMVWNNKKEIFETDEFLVMSYTKSC